MINDKLINTKSKLKIIIWQSFMVIFFSNLWNFNIKDIIIGSWKGFLRFVMGSSLFNSTQTSREVSQVNQNKAYKSILYKNTLLLCACVSLRSFPGEGRGSFIGECERGYDKFEIRTSDY